MIHSTATTGFRMAVVPSSSPRRQHRSTTAPQHFLLAGVFVRYLGPHHGFRLALFYSCFASNLDPDRRCLGCCCDSDCDAAVTHAAAAGADLMGDTCNACTFKCREAVIEKAKVTNIIAFAMMWSHSECCAKLTASLSSSIAAASQENLAPATVCVIVLLGFVFTASFYLLLIGYDEAGMLLNHSAGAGSNRYSLCVSNF